LRIFVMLVLGLSLALSAAAQEDAANSLPPASHDRPATPDNPATANGSSGTAQDQTSQPAGLQSGQPGQSGQSNRVLGMMPNFRVVSPGAIPAAPTAKLNFMLATRSSFDYSAFVFTGLTSALAQWTDSTPQFGEGMRGYERYYQHGFLDKTDGNYLVMFALPTVFHQDERYYAMGRGSKWKRMFYAASRVAITPNYQGRESFNVSELLGRGIAQGISTAYYPSEERTFDHTTSRYGFAVMHDALTNIFLEFWPDIHARLLLHRRQKSADLAASN
jgi:hypothetical protein